MSAVEELVALLHADDCAADTTDVAPPLEDLRCHPDLVERVAELGRFTNAALRFGAGCPILVRRDDGRMFAAATGTALLLLRLDGGHPGSLAAEPPRIVGLSDDWWSVQPWPQDVTFLRGTTMLRDVVSRAAAIRRA